MNRGARDQGDAEAVDVALWQYARHGLLLHDTECLVNVDSK